ncbi:Pr6Pr family membrane protein [Alloscardovia omnicolens]|uniref:Pr6Pr family membrane protein n=1 Tax=Alloscardovia omnicolens TaxID=419015 RepID=UPI003A79F52D
MSDYIESGSRHSGARVAWWVVSALAWFGVIVTNIGNIFDVYPRESGHWPGLYGHSAHGMAGAWQRFIEGMSYFTMVSNIVVAVVFTMLALGMRKTAWHVALVNTALLMISVTSLVFLVAILPFLHLRGLALLTSPWQHMVVPIAVWIVWAMWGPRDFFGGFARGEILLRSYMIPWLWAVWMLAYGAVTHYYPYGFVNVNQLGYASVMVSLCVVMILALFFELLFYWIDRLLMKSGV